MAEETIATQVDEGAVGDTGSSQDSGSASQDVSQSQDSTQHQVDDAGKTSSVAGQGRKSNQSWATERIIEKSLKKHTQSLEDRLTSLIESRLNPPAKSTPNIEDVVGQPDYNNLNQWITKAVAQLTKEQLGQAIPEIEKRFSLNLKETSKTQEARNYLLSQEDIGSDSEKLSEIEQIMKDEMLDYAAVHNPIGAVRKAVGIWRKSHSNPNKPKSGELSTVAGGTAAKPKGEPSMARLRELQALVAKGLPTDELEKVSAEIDSLFK